MSNQTNQEKMDESFMRQALALAVNAAEVGEVPVGAIVVLDGEVIGRGFNRTITDNDPSAHAEVVAVRDAAKHCANHRLTSATLYVTLEPCLMCCGCMQHARLSRLVFGAREQKTGAVVSVNEVLTERNALHSINVTEGVLAEDAKQLLQQFFRERR